MQNRREFIGSGLGLLSALALKRKAFSGGPLAGSRGGDCIDTGAASYDASCPMQQIRNVPTQLVDGIPFASWYTGDDFPGLHHPMPNPNCFDGDLPPISEEIDVAVVGGGISGLTSAYLLRDRNPVIFEMHNQFGGAARGEEWNGVPYSLGNAYVITPDPGTFLQDIYQELGMNEVVRIDSNNPPVELEGEVLEGFFDGQGAFILNDGTRYEGQWRRSIPTNKGVKILPNGTHYDGNWKDSIVQDYQVYRLGEGFHYEGEYKNSLFHGQGILVWADGTRYEGEFKDGLEHGQGVYIWDDGSYEGEFKDG